MPVAEWGGQPCAWSPPCGDGKGAVSRGATLPCALTLLPPVQTPQPNLTLLAQPGTSRAFPVKPSKIPSTITGEAGGTSCGFVFFFFHPHPGGKEKKKIAYGLETVPLRERLQRPPDGANTGSQSSAQGD